MEKYILVVDDELEVLGTLNSRLIKEGYKVKTVETGKEATQAFVESYYDQPFDVILLDVGLPDINGCDVLKGIRQEEEIRGLKYDDGVKIIMQTGLKESWMDAFNQGCDDYIIKPYVFEDLLKKIKEKTGEIPMEG
ncbi:response regulator transcription factor [candidate division KSB1 bacterium]|nr:response regulator transcription factor [candidate division KSB1 bacterium]